jgi:hypothetical protein
MPLVVFLLLFVLLLMLLGFACACFSDHPMQAVERALTALSNPAPLVEVWSPLIVLLLAMPLVFLAHSRAVGRASPATLQRFLF